MQAKYEGARKDRHAHFLSFLHVSLFALSDSNACSYISIRSLNYLRGTRGTTRSLGNEQQCEQLVNSFEQYNRHLLLLPLSRSLLISLYFVPCIHE